MTDVNTCHQVSVRACQQDPPQLYNVSSRYHTAVSEPKFEANFLSFNRQTMIGSGVSLKNTKLKWEEMEREREKDFTSMNEIDLSFVCLSDGLE
jgi:hypothetical protein